MAQIMTSIPSTSSLSQNEDPTLRPKISTDDYLTVDDLLRSRLAEVPDVPLVGYPAETAYDYTFYTLRQLDRFTNNVVNRLHAQGLSPHVSHITDKLA